jgi:hypothetical protein
MQNCKSCPVCGCEDFTIDRSPEEIEAESVLRSCFVSQRLGKPPHGSDAMDLTAFTHGTPARILSCRQCGMLVREESVPVSYQAELWDTDLLNHLYPRMVRSFGTRESRYRQLLREKAEVLEVGSFTGAFLEAAETWGWRPTGIDIGHSAISFARTRGTLVKPTAIEDYSPHLRQPEAIFIWNCFEQLDDPSSTLQRSHELLGRHGLLVLRVPNAAFYLRNRDRVFQSPSTLSALGYNNLLAFPYLHGYTPNLLSDLVVRHGFEPLHWYRSDVQTPPYPDFNALINEEWQRTRRYGHPWIELVARRKAS